RERLAKVKPSVRIDPTGPRSCELVITRRLHELSFGLKEALNLARFIEGAIKCRNPVKSNRKQSWRQKLRSHILYRPGELTWLTRNPMDNGKWTMDNEGQNASLPQCYLELIDRRWLTTDGNLFETTPGGDFATSVEGFPLRLPVAVMPPEIYERWLARGKNRSRKRRRARASLRRRNKAGCTCFFARKIRPAFLNGGKVKSGFS
ncbi:MAG: hypothetical protein ABIP75_03365, partial [Pyrinomonadaceae bacterium]